MNGKHRIVLYFYFLFPFRSRYISNFCFLSFSFVISIFLAYDETLAPILDLGVDVLTSKLIDASKAGNLSRIKALVQVGADAARADYDGRTPMHLSAAAGHLECMVYLNTQHGVDIFAVDRYGNNPLHDAMHNNQTAVVRWLKSLGATASADSGYVKDRDILQAAADGNVEEVKWRLKMDASVANTFDYDRRTPLHVASSEGHRIVVRELLRQNADPYALDRWGLDPLACAVKGKHASTAEELSSWIGRQTRSQSITSTSPRSQRSSIPSRQNTPRRSSGGEQFSLFGIKIEETEDDNGDSLSLPLLNPESFALVMSVASRALITAAERGDLHEIKKLVSKGADVNAADYDGRTSAHLASSSGHIDVMQYLVKQNECNLDVFDRFGRTPLQDALGKISFVS